MGNPVTQAILKKIDDPELIQFVTAWDELERLVVGVFRRKAASTSEKEMYTRLQQSLMAAYPHWQPALQTYWQHSRIKGGQAMSDPFLRLLSTRQAEDFIGDWEAMKFLPAAREALNNYLLSWVGDS
jgi:hypothetical protein